MNPHHLGSRGYAKKMLEFEAELQKMDRLAEKAFRLRPPIGSLDRYYTVWGEMYSTPRTGALAPQMYP